MPAYRKASIREVSSSAYELGGRVLQGILRRNPQDGTVKISETAILDWLSRYEGQEVALILLPVEEEVPLDVRSCRTCGRDYVGSECPTCKEARIRLRGR